MRDLTHNILEGTSIHSGISANQAPHLDSASAPGDPVGWNNLSAVLVPREHRNRCASRLTEYINGFTNFLDEETRRNLSENRRSWKEQQKIKVKWKRSHTSLQAHAQSLQLVQGRNQEFKLGGGQFFGARTTLPSFPLPFILLPPPALDVFRLR